MYRIGAMVVGPPQEATMTTIGAVGPWSFSQTLARGVVTSIYILYNTSTTCTVEAVIKRIQSFF